MDRFQMAEDGRVVEDTFTGDLFRFDSTDEALFKCELWNLEWENNLLKEVGLD